VSLFPTRLAAAGVRGCALQMLRLESPGFALPGTVMSDLSLMRYRGFANLPEAGALRRRVEQEQPAHLRHRIHLVIAQGSDGSLVVGDSHHYDAATEPFADEAVYDLLLDGYRAVIGQAPPAVRERSTGTYAVANDRAVLMRAPSPRTRLVVVTSGVGAAMASPLAKKSSTSSSTEHPDAMSLVSCVDLLKNARVAAAWTAAQRATPTARHCDAVICKLRPLRELGACRS
jgi:hypothetical protein